MTERVRVADLSARILHQIRGLDKSGAYREPLTELAAGLLEGVAPELRVLRADLNAYRDRREESLDDIQASAVLKQSLAEVSPVGDLARRRELVRVDLAIASGHFDEAERRASTVELLSGSAGDAASAVRSRYSRGRIGRYAGDLKTGLERSTIARDFAADAGLEFYAGLAELNRAICLYELRLRAEAEVAYTRAIELLGATERYRFFAGAQNSYSNLLSDEGRYQDALEAIGAAEGILVDLGGLGELQWVQYNRCRALFCLGQSKAAADGLAELISMSRARDDLYFEMLAEQLLVKAEMRRGNVEAARTAARRGMEIATTLDMPSWVTASSVYLAWAGTEAGPMPIDAFRECIAAVDAEDAPEMRVLVRAYFAQTFALDAPIDAGLALSDARRIEAEFPVAWLRDEIARSQVALNASPIRVTKGGGLYVSPEWERLPFRALMSLAERFAFTDAMRRGGGRLADAGRILGEPRQNMLRIGKRQGRGPKAGPPDAEGGPAPADRPTQKSAARKSKTKSKPDQGV